MMNRQKKRLLLYLLRYFKSRKGEHRLFNRRQAWLLAGALGYLLVPDEYLVAGIEKIGLADDLTVIIGAAMAVFLPSSGQDSDSNSDNG